MEKDEKKESKAVELEQVIFNSYRGPDQRSSYIRDERTRISWQGRVVVIQRSGVEAPYIFPLHVVDEMRPAVKKP